MKLENRVEALEHELKILKNEIQVTLLEIQEQILNHYYPELRAGEESRPKPSPTANRRRAAANENGYTKPKAEASLVGSTQNGAGHRAMRSAVSTPPFSDFELDDLLNDEEGGEFAGEHGDEFDTADGLVRFDGDFDNDFDDDVDGEDESDVTALPPRPQVREVALHRGHMVAKPRRGGHAAQAAPSGPVPNRRVFAALATWVGDSVATIGKARTLEVIETYAASGGGQLTGRNKEAMQRLAALADDTEPEEPASNKAAMSLLVQLDEILGED